MPSLEVVSPGTLLALLSGGRSYVQEELDRLVDPAGDVPNLIVTVSQQDGEERLKLLPLAGDLDERQIAERLRQAVRSEGAAACLLLMTVWVSSAASLRPSLQPDRSEMVIQGAWTRDGRQLAEGAALRRSRQARPRLERWAPLDGMPFQFEQAVRDAFANDAG
jgi:hypothetical protein